MGLEQTFWAWFREHTKKIEGLRLQRIENQVSRGVPDVFGHFGSTSFWIEMKACDRPARESSLLQFEIYREQIIWLQKWWEVGCQCYVLIRVGQGTKARIYLIRGCDVGHLTKCHESDLKGLSALDNNIANPEAMAIIRRIIHLKQFSFLAKPQFRRLTNGPSDN